MIRKPFVLLAASADKAKSKLSDYVGFLCIAAVRNLDTNIAFMKYLGT